MFSKNDSNKNELLQRMNKSCSRWEWLFQFNKNCKTRKTQPGCRTWI